MEIEMSKEVEVDGVRYLITHPNPEAGIRLGVELLKLIGESAASLAQVDPDKASEALASAVKLLLQNLEPDKFVDITKRVLSTVEIQSDKKMLINSTVYSAHFRGRLGSLMTLTAEALAFTHESFFNAIVDGVAVMMKKAGEKITA